MKFQTCGSVVISPQYAKESVWCLTFALLRDIKRKHFVVQ